MGITVNNLKTIMWKNYVLRKRHWILSTLEVIVPCGIFAVFLIARLNTGPEDDLSTPAIIKKPYLPDDCFGRIVWENFTLFYTPKTSFTEKFMSLVKEKIVSKLTRIGKPVELKLKPMNSERDMEDYFMTTIEKYENEGKHMEGVTFCGVVFDITDKKLQYKIRINNEGFQTHRLRSSYKNAATRKDIYKETCFLGFQKTIDCVYIEMVTDNKSRVPEIMINTVPYPKRDVKGDTFLDFLYYFAPLAVVCGFGVVVPMLIKKIVEEKQTGVKELMKLMGLKGWIVWAGWLLFANMGFIIVSTICAILLTVQFKKDIPAVIPNTNIILVWFLLFLTMNAATVYVFVICAWFHRPVIAVPVGILVYFAPVHVWQMLFIQNAIPNKIIPCIFPTRAVVEGFQVITIFAGYNVKIGFNNLFEKLRKGTEDNDSLSLGTVFVMLLIDMLIYSILTWYIDNVRPGPYGVAKPWHFLCSCFHKKRKDESGNENNDDTIDETYFEKPPENLSVGLSVKNITKKYPPSVHAVRGISIDFYEGQITALLGHNGAGKTTTMSMISGMFSPTSGTIYKYDSVTGDRINIFERMDQYRKSLGLCPQENMLISYLNVIEHLIFFGMLRGMTLAESKRYGTELLGTLNILDKKHVKAYKLSGGMKRKLSLAISLMGSPKVLMLDEPTSGMDPESRREMWDMLLGIRKDRTIVITTHFMEEADVLGDRIAIMDHGKVQCYGSTMFLKKAYGAGYNLTLLTLPGADYKKISQTVQTLVPGSSMKTYHEGQIVFNLPSANSSKLARLFMGIESDKSPLQITSIGLSCTTMEDVFLKVGDISGSKNIKTTDSNKTSTTRNISSRKISGINFIFTQFWFLLLKKVRFTYRNIWTYIIFTLFGVVLITFGLYLPKLDERSNYVELLQFDLDLYESSEVFVSYTDDVLKHKDIYKSLIKSSKVHLLSNENIVTELLKFAKRDIFDYTYKVVVSANWTVEIATGLHSATATHSSPISLNLITNTLLKIHRNDLSIVVINKPLTLNSKQCPLDSLGNEAFHIAFIWVFFIPLSFLFIVAFFIDFPLYERTSGLKHLQLMTGVSPIVYWLSTLVCDYVLFIFTSFLLVIPILIWNYDNNVFPFIFIFIILIIINLFGLSIITFVYFVSYLRKNHVAGSSYFIFYNMIFIFIIMVWFGFSIPYFFSFKSKGDVLSYIIHILTLNPYFCFAYVVYRTALYSSKIIRCDLCHVQFKNMPVSLGIVHRKLKCHSGESLFEFDISLFGIGIYLYLLILLIDVIIYVILMLLMEYRIFTRLYNKLMTPFIEQFEYDNEDDDNSIDDNVMEEYNRVDELLEKKSSSFLRLSPALIVEELVKTYGKNFHAVRGISFVVNRRECFGFLGVNGAGKTTTFKMLVGEIIPTEGDALINRFSIFNERSEYLKQIGYCPQFDALNEVLTSREMIHLFVRLRGFSSEDSDDVTNYWLKYMGLEEYSDRRCGTYSGGNKRKLSTAMALVGDPVIVFLDEPTSGVDPVARRQLWDVLATSKKSGKSIVLTSHSMDECEALCDRLTIMVRGEMVCIGKIQYLKQKFGRGFTLMVKLRLGDKSNEGIKNDIETTFAPGCVLKDEHSGLLHYHITDVNKTWFTLFDSMDQIKQKHSAVVEDYTISETTLEEVFISFAKQQEES